MGYFHWLCQSIWSSSQRNTLEIKKKFSIPPKFIWLIIALHRIIVQLSIDGAEADIESIIGVKQGDVLGPIIFIIYLVALTNTWKQKEDTSPCLFR